jgi:outer membrane lipoprotein-sorting protein
MVGAFVAAGNTATAAPDAVSPRIEDYAASLNDFIATMHVDSYDDRNGEKINRDFGYIYKLHGDINVKYKEQNELRLDGRLGASHVTFIVNQARQFVRMKELGIKTTADLGASPGKRKTLLDVGLISRGYLAYTEAKFIGPRPIGGVMCGLFSISYRNKDLDTSHRLVWIDPVSKVTLKREEYSQEGKLNATFYYKDPVQVSPGNWFPTHIVVMNNEGQLAGQTSYHNVQVNQGLTDDLFKM